MKIVSFYLAVLVAEYWFHLAVGKTVSTKSLSSVGSARKLANLSAEIKSKLNNKCIDLNDQNGNVYLFECHGGSNQKWHYDRSTHEMKSEKNDHCLDYNFENGNLFSHACHGGTNQKWKFDDRGRIVSERDNKCIQKKSTDDDLIVTDCNDDLSQKFLLPSGFLPPRVGGNGGGDPHFRTLDGTKYSFHGECDLVMTRSNSFGTDLGLDLHIRTKSMGSWSLISHAALRIGEDIFEFENDGSHYINGEPMALPYDLAGHYSVTKERTITEKKNNDGTIHTIDKTVATVELGPDKFIRFARLGKGIMFVKVNAFWEDAEGMLGTPAVQGMVGRDGHTVLEDPNEMGAQWQVNDTEPMLFREIRAPQYPQTCKLPALDATHRRLRLSSVEREKAEESCAKVADESRSLCIDDVLLSGDIHSADGYLFGEAF